MADQVSVAKRALNGLKVNELKDLLRQLSRPLSGNKADLLYRLYTYAEKEPRDILQLISSQSQRTAVGARSLQHTPSHSHPAAPGPSHIPAAPKFVDNPYLSEARALIACTRIASPAYIVFKSPSIASFQLILSEADLLSLTNGTARVYIRCGVRGKKTADFLDNFPRPCYWTLNSSIIADLNGSSAVSRPIDITPNIAGPSGGAFHRLELHVQNSTIVSAVPDHHMTVVIAQPRTLAQLLTLLPRVPAATRKSWISTKLAATGDSDVIVASTMTVTLRCPLSQVRLALPCRGRQCDHIQCFDASTFLKMNERKPSWQCPVCNKNLSFSDLLVDEFFVDVLAQSTVACAEIVINADATWKEGTDIEDEDDDDDAPPAKRSHLDAHALDLEDAARTAEINHIAQELRNASQPSTPGAGLGRGTSTGAGAGPAEPFIPLGLASLLGLPTPMSAPRTPAAAAAAAAAAPARSLSPLLLPSSAVTASPSLAQASTPHAARTPQPLPVPLSPPTTPPPVIWELTLTVAGKLTVSGPQQLLESPARASLTTRTINPALLPRALRFYTELRGDMLTAFRRLRSPLARATLNTIMDSSCKSVLEARLAQSPDVCLITNDSTSNPTTLTVTPGGDLELIVYGPAPSTPPPVLMPLPLPGRVPVPGRPRPIGDIHNPICLD